MGKRQNGYQRARRKKNKVVKQVKQALSGQMMDEQVLFDAVSTFMEEENKKTSE